MAATTISRNVWTDGVSGTVLANARLQGDVYDKIDALIAANITFGGTISAEGFGAHSLSAAGSGANQLTVRNSTAGTSNRGEVVAQADGSGALSLQMFSTTYTPSGASTAAGGRLVLTGAGTLGVETVAAGGIRFYPGGGLRASVDFANGLIAENQFGLVIKNSAGTAIDGIVLTSANEMRIGSDASANVVDTLIKAGASIRFRTDGAERVVISATGMLRCSDGGVGAPGVSFKDDTDTGFYRSASDEISLATGGGQRTSWSVTGTLDHRAALKTSGKQAFTLGAGDNNDISVLTNVSVVLLTPNAAGSNITGIQGGSDTRHLFLINVGTITVTLENNMIADSSAANCIQFDNVTPGGTISITPGRCAHLIYDSTAAGGGGRWRVLAN